MIELVFAMMVAQVENAGPDCDQDFDTRSMAICAANDLEKAETEMARVLGEARVDLAKWDEIHGESSNPPSPTLVETLEKAQAAWLDYREAQCLGAYYVYYGGSAANLSGLGCRVRLTEQRVEDIKAVYHHWHYENSD